MILYKLITGELPFKFPYLKSIRAKKDNFAFDESVSDQAADLIRRCLRYSQQDRITLAELLEHPFLSASKLTYTGQIITELKPSSAATVSTSPSTFSGKASSDLFDDEMYNYQLD